MTAKGPWPGRVVWHDLMTTDSARAKRFYQELFDWRIKDEPMLGFVYHMLVSGPGPTGGIVEEADIEHSHWMPYLEVQDVDKAAERCLKLGGTVCVQPVDFPTGRFAVLGDPQGVLFSVRKGNKELPGIDPAEPMPGRVCWNEVLTSDDQAAQRFYGAMFGWRNETKDMGPMGTYHLQLLENQQVCGIMNNPMNGAPDTWLAYFLVEDLQAATDKAKALGATAMMENAPIPDVGAFSMLSDPTGAVFALFEGGGGSQSD